MCPPLTRDFIPCSFTDTVRIYDKNIYMLAFILYIAQLKDLVPKGSVKNALL